MENNDLPQFMEENVSLQKYSTFKIGGDARYFCCLKNEIEVRGALDFAVAKKLNVFVIGKGSNLLVSDRGFDGLVLKIENSETALEETAAGFVATLGCGIAVTKFILDLQRQNIGGLEWAAGIPATLGGAVCNNAGAHGQEMSDAVEEVRTLEMEFDSDTKALLSYEMRIIQKAECEFSYRDSLFKKTKSFVILGATLLLQKGEAEEIKKTIDGNLKSRLEKQPLEYPNVGSIFRNPVLTDEEMNKLYAKCPSAREMFKNNTIPAGWLIEQVDLKGKQIGGAAVSTKHANFIVNIDNARAEDVVILISLIKEKVSSQFDIHLHEEIEYVGF